MAENIRMLSSQSDRIFNAINVLVDTNTNPRLIWIIKIWSRSVLGVTTFDVSVYKLCRSHENTRREYINKNMHFGGSRFWKYQFNPLTPRSD